MNKILSNIPDKRIDKNTTSLQFKQDVITFFTDMQLDNCIEVGTSYGYSTHVLSHIFKNVTTIDININHIDKAKTFNVDRTNINYLLGDSTGTDWSLDEKFDVAFIDADHSYKAVVRDIQQCISVGKPNMYIIFDDYGLPEKEPAVKQAVDEYIANGTLSIIKYIGEPAGSEPRVGRPLVDWEGIITKVNQNANI